MPTRHYAQKDRYQILGEAPRFVRLGKVSPALDLHPKLGQKLRGTRNSFWMCAVFTP
jgi:hypothetical protein